MLVQTNRKLINASGYCLDNIRLVELKAGNAGRDDMNYISIEVYASENTSDVFSKIKEFLSGDLSTITENYDLVYAESKEKHSSQTKVYVDYTLDPIINLLGNTNESTKRYYQIRLLQQNKAYKQAVETYENTVMMCEAIADIYESE